MFARWSWGRAEHGGWDRYERFYRESVLPEAVDAGSLRRQLLRSAGNPDEGVSVSYWKSLEDVEAYEASAQYVDKLPHMAFWVDHEWPKRFELRTSTWGPDNPPPLFGTPPFVRVAWGWAPGGGWNAYEAFYRETVAPRDDEVEGLLGRQLLRGAAGGSGGLSVSIWDTAERAEAYGRSELYVSNREAMGDLWVDSPSWNKGFLLMAER